jgi:hypothetical protein
MDYGKALSFITEDPRWLTKLAIGTGLVLVSFLLSWIIVGIVGFVILAGYSIRLFQNVRDGVAYPLPEWDQWGDDLVRGFKLVVVALVWALPMIFLAIPTGIGSAMSNSRGAGATLGGLIMACTGCLSLLYWLFYAVVSPGFMIRFAEDEQISSGLQFTEIWSWTQAHVGQVIMAVIVVLIASFAIQLVSWLGIILCGVGLIVTLPLGVLVADFFGVHVYGQLARAFPTGRAPAYVEPMPAPSDVAATSMVVMPPAPEPPPAPIVPVEEPPAPAPETPDIAASTPPEEPPSPTSTEDNPQPPIA